MGKVKVLRSKKDSANELSVVEAIDLDDFERRLSELEKRNMKGDRS